MPRLKKNKWLPSIDWCEIQPQLVSALINRTLSNGNNLFISSLAETVLRRLFAALKMAGLVKKIFDTKRQRSMGASTFGAGGEPRCCSAKLLLLS